jgi:hypothetical protein
MYENLKMRPVETIPGKGGGGIKENDGGSKFNYDICKNFGVCHNVLHNKFFTKGKRVTQNTYIPINWKI